jgi:hypothetical protein
MGSLPLGKAGVGSAVNDTTRQVGGALGVAVIGSVTASVYSSRVTDFLHGKALPSGTAREVEQSLGVALQHSRDVAGLSTTAIDAFVAGLHVGMWVAAVVAFGGAVIALLWLPARAQEEAPVAIPAEAPVADPPIATPT